MRFLEKLEERKRATRAILCIGLDPDLDKMPRGIADAPRPLYEFCRRIVEATAPYAAAFKPNLAFFESSGSAGLAQLERLMAEIPAEIPTIIDGKRGDIGNTARMYAQFVFGHLGGDAATVNPFLGRDSIEPFFEFPDKLPIVLCLTSNPGSMDIQMVSTGEHRIYQKIILLLRRVQKPCGLVVGARHTQLLEDVRRLAPEWPILIPGVGTQGGDLAESVRTGTSDGKAPAVINVSRDILYAGEGENFAEAAAAKAKWYAEEMAKALARPAPPKRP
ncbi:MAG: orotidine-5'-phosphate decarboxylase [Candidatus Zixiibacteriota bacterium]